MYPKVLLTIWFGTKPSITNNVAQYNNHVVGKEPTHIKNQYAFLCETKTARIVKTLLIIDTSELITTKFYHILFHPFKLLRWHRVR